MILKICVYHSQCYNPIFQNYQNQSYHKILFKITKINQSYQTVTVMDKLADMHG